MRKLNMLPLLLSLIGSSAWATPEEAAKALQAHDYDKAVELYHASFKSTRSPDALYNAACAYALKGDREHAFADLDAAIEAGYSDLRNASGDNDLKSLHADARWEPLLARLTARSQLASRLYDSKALATPYNERISEDERIAGLSKLWSEVKYNFIYTDVLRKLDWDQVYKDYLPRVRAASSTRDYYRILMEMMARLGDGHSNVIPPEALLDQLFARPALTLSLIDGRVFIREVVDPELREKKLKEGLEIVEIEGMPVKEYAHLHIEPYISASTEQDRQSRVFEGSLLRGALDQPVKLTLVDASGQNMKVELARKPFQQARSLLQRPLVELKDLPGGVLQVRLNSFRDEATDRAYFEAWPRIAAARALILDVRDNGGGSSSVGYRILATLGDQPFATSRWATRDYRPSFRAWGRPLDLYSEAAESFQPDLAHQFHGPVVVLTSARTYSAAEDFVVAFEQMKRGTQVGEPTGGSTGQPLMFSLPGGGIALVCTKLDTYADGHPFVGVGIMPAVRVSPRIEDLRAGRDTVLEAALEGLK